MSKVIAITYDDGCGESRYLIDKEDDRYVYMTSGWTGQRMRYDKDENCLELRLCNGSYQTTTDCIIQTDITD